MMELIKLTENRRTLTIKLTKPTLSERGIETRFQSIQRTPSFSQVSDAHDCRQHPNLGLPNIRTQVLRRLQSIRYLTSENEIHK